MRLLKVLIRLCPDEVIKGSDEVIKGSDKVMT